MIEGLFWACALLLGYIHLGYAALVGMWALLWSRPPRATDGTPTVSLVTVAHNEASRIRRRIENLLALDYPPDRLEILLASD